MAQGLSKGTVLATPPGRVVQVVKTVDGEVATGTTLFVLDDSIPQNTEGNEFMTCSITPQNENNLLRIDVVMNMFHSGTPSQLIAALFQDSTADAIASAWTAKDSAAATALQVMFTHWLTAGTIASTTFKARGGAAVAGTTTFNGATGSRYMGGTFASSITITEYKV